MTDTPSVSPSQTDVERREAERRALIAELHGRDLLDEVLALRGALHESRKDRERLDWMEQYADYLQFDAVRGWFCAGRRNGEDVDGEAAQIREAIDAARSGNGETT